jgi:hypothetical protein
MSGDFIGKLEISRDSKGALCARLHLVKCLPTKGWGGKRVVVVVNARDA